MLQGCDEAWALGALADAGARCAVRLLHAFVLPIHGAESQSEPEPPITADGSGSAADDAHGCGVRLFIVLELLAGSVACLRPPRTLGDGDAEVEGGWLLPLGMLLELSVQLLRAVAELHGAATWRALPPARGIAQR